jgi:hypothetical protein
LGEAVLATDDEIRALCLLVLQAKCNEDFEESISSLKTALTEHFIETENLAIHMLMNMPKQTALVFDRGHDEDDKKPNE